MELNKRLKEIKELKAVILATQGDDNKAMAAGVLITEDEFKRRVRNNDSFPPYFVVKIDDRYYVMKYENGEVIPVVN